MSLRGLARAVGVSPSLISQIEHGKATPSVGTLYAIVSELDISLDELFFDGPRGAAAAPAPAAKPRPAARRPRPTSGRRRARVRSCAPPTASRSRSPPTSAGSGSPPPTTPGRVPLRHLPGRRRVLPGRRPDAPQRHRVRAGSSGRLGATVGEESYELGPGDSIAFDSPRPHRIWTTGESRRPRLDRGRPRGRPAGQLSQLVVPFRPLGLKRNHELISRPTWSRRGS